MDKRSSDLAPKARTELLVVEELDDEVLVYDLNNQKAHCLNRTTALVWKNCDGNTSVSELVEILSEELGSPVDEQVVWLALAQLSEDVLVNQEIDKPKGLSRRQVLKMGLAVAAVPLISTIVAPTVSFAASGACAPCPPNNCIPHSCPGCSLGVGPGTGCCSPYPDCHGGGLPGAISCCKPSGSSGSNVCGHVGSGGHCD